MRNLLLLLFISFSLLSCASRTDVIPGGFYDKVLQEKRAFRDFLKYKGNQKKLELFDYILVDSRKVIMVSMDYTDVLYDVTNDKYYLIRKYYSLSREYRGKIRDIKLILKQDVPETYLFWNMF